MIEPLCRINGANFYPSKLNLSCPITKYNDPGDIGKRGKYKDKNIPYGSCIFTVPEDINDSDKILWMARFILENFDYFQDSGAEEINFHISWYGIQGNMELSNNEIKAIAKLNIPLTITYIQDK